MTIDARLITHIRNSFAETNKEPLLLNDEEIMHAMTTIVFHNLPAQESYFKSENDKLKGERAEAGIEVIQFPSATDPYPIEFVAKDSLPTWFMAFTFMFMHACEGAILELSEVQLSQTMDMMHVHGHSTSDIEIFMEMVVQLRETNEAGELVSHQKGEAETSATDGNLQNDTNL